MMKNVLVLILALAIMFCLASCWRCCYREPCKRSGKHAHYCVEKPTKLSLCNVEYEINFVGKCSLKALRATECCFVDPCDNSKPICAKGGERMADSCGRQFLVSNISCTLLYEKKDTFKEYCMPDSCDPPNKMCEGGKGLLKDSCGDYFYTVNLKKRRVAKRLKRKSCGCYLDQCKFEDDKICPRRGDMFKDSCKDTFHVGICCEIQIDAVFVTKCCYKDSCNSDHRICADKDNTVKDACNRTYGVNPIDCSVELSTETDEKYCCYKDGCNNDKTICESWGRTLTDSCGRSYRVLNPSCTLKQIEEGDRSSEPSPGN